jgi:hypothetical protein
MNPRLRLRKNYDKRAPEDRGPLVTAQPALMTERGQDCSFPPTVSKVRSLAAVPGAKIEVPVPPRAALSRGPSAAPSPALTAGPTSTNRHTCPAPANRAVLVEGEPCGVERVHAQHPSREGVSSGHRRSVDDFAIEQSAQRDEPSVLKSRSGGLGHLGDEIVA